MAGTFREILQAILGNKLEDPAGTVADVLAAKDVAQLSLTDGVTEPGTVTGVAQIYVDAADGDLKVKFGDGTVKLLSADT